MGVLRDSIRRLLHEHIGAGAAYDVPAVSADGMDLRFEVEAQLGENSHQRSGQLKFVMPVGGKTR